MHTITNNKIENIGQQRSKEIVIPKNPSGSRKLSGSLFPAKLSGSFFIIDFPLKCPTGKLKSFTFPLDAVTVAFLGCCIIFFIICVVFCHSDEFFHYCLESPSVVKIATMCI